MSTVAVVLSGCGFLDGSEVQESVLLMTYLSRKGYKYQCFAPDRAQLEVVNHFDKATCKGENRNCLVESARITRGSIEPLAKLNPSRFDALAIPGGFGVAKNLSDFDSYGIDFVVDAVLEKIILEFHSSKKPIGVTCIAPILVAKALSGQVKAKLTLGNDPKFQEILTELGMESVQCAVEDSVYDSENLIASTPCYMEESATLSQVSQGIEGLISYFSS